VDARDIRAFTPVFDVHIRAFTPVFDVHIRAFTPVFDVLWRRHDDALLHERG
jgi:hypothetical protein